MIVRFLVILLATIIIVALLSEKALISVVLFILLYDKFKHKHFHKKHQHVIIIKDKKTKIRNIKVKKGKKDGK